MAIIATTRAVPADVENRTASVHTPCRSASSGKELMRYRSLGEATSQVRSLVQRYGKQLRPYECKNCGYWHLSGAVDRTQRAAGRL